MNYRELEADEALALQAFADAHGRCWKTTLSSVYWYNARIWEGPKPNMGNLLHGIRNDLGPTWLFEVCNIKNGRK